MTRQELLREARDLAHLSSTATDSLMAVTGCDHDEAERALEHVRRFPLALALEDLPPAEPVDFYWPGYVTSREPAAIVGGDGVGKSTLLITLLVGSAAHAPDIFGRTDMAPAPGPSLLISDEDSAGVILNRAEAICRGHGWSWERARGQFYVLALEGVQLDDPGWRAHILDEVERVRPVAVGLDPYADISNARENDNDDARVVKRFLRELCEAGTTPIVSHHLGKPQEGRGKKDRIRGASAFAAAMRSIVSLEECEAGIAIESLKLSRSERPAPFVLSRVVESDPESPAVWRSARLEYVTEREAEEDTADKYVLRTLAQYPFSNSTEIKELAKGSGLSAPQISKAIKRLHVLRRIEFQSGKRNAKHWYRPDLTTLPEDSRQGGQGTLPSLPKPAGQGREGTDDPALFIEEAGSGKVPSSFGQADGFSCAAGCSADVGSRGTVCIRCQREGRAAA